MKKIAAAVAALFVATAVAQDKGAKAPDAKGVAAAEVTRVVSTVESIDQASRVVTLKGKDGKTVTFVAGPEVKNLAQVQKGDVVTMEYIEAVAVALKKTDSKVRERTETEFKKGAAPGQKPAGIVGKDVKIVASVEAVDAKAQTVRLRGPERTIDLKVKDPAILKNVKVGDMVEAEFVEALAVKVEKAPAPPAAPAKK
jgi:Cu/Ag efflux protein CusF